MAGRRVTVRRFNGSTYAAELVSEEGQSVIVWPDGGAKPIAVARSRCRFEERPSITSPPLEQPPVTTAPLRALPRPASPARDRSYLAFVRTHPCIGCRTLRDVRAHTLKAGLPYDEIAEAVRLRGAA